MNQRHYRILGEVAALGPDDAGIDYSGADYAAARYLWEKRLVRGGENTLDGGGAAITLWQILPAGQDALDERRGRFRRFLLRHAGKVFYAVLTAALCYAASRLGGEGGVKAFLDSFKAPPVGPGFERCDDAPGQAPSEEDVEDADEQP